MGCVKSTPVEQDTYYSSDGWIVAGTQVVPQHSYPGEFFQYDPKIKLNLPCLDNSKIAQCDLFYVHSFSLNDTNRKEIEMHCSLFNNCCQLYCPKYNAAIDITNIKQLNNAYNDIKQAFTVFLVNYNHTRPFILAGQGQGSYLLYRLIREEFLNHTPKGEDLCARCVAAYLPGINILQSEFSSNCKLLEISTNPNDTKVVVSWKTCYKTPCEAVYDLDINLSSSDNRNQKKMKKKQKNNDNVKQIRNKSKATVDEKSDDVEDGYIANNPLSFNKANMNVELSENRGSMNGNGVLQPMITGCYFIRDNYFQLTHDISKFNSMKSDYLPFYMDIRINAAVRVDHWMRQQRL